jgi:hypothetical protein
MFSAVQRYVRFRGKSGSGCGTLEVTFLTLNRHTSRRICAAIQAENTTKAWTTRFIVITGKLPAGDAHVAVDGSAPVAAVDDEVVSFGLAIDGGIKVTIIGVVCGNSKRSSQPT